MGKYKVAILTEEHTNVRRVGSNVFEEQAMQPIWCAYKIEDVIAAKDSTDIFLLFLPEKPNRDLRQICFYLRDICIDEEKMVYLYGGKDMLAYARSIIPGMMICGMFLKDNRRVEDALLRIKADIYARASSRKSFLILDDGQQYLRDLSIMLRDNFQVTLKKPCIEEVLADLRMADIIIVNVDLQLTILEQAVLFDAIEKWRKAGRLKLILLTERREEQNQVNLIGARFSICLTKETPAEKVAAYLKKNYGDCQSK